LRVTREKLTPRQNYHAGSTAPHHDVGDNGHAVFVDSRAAVRMRLGTRRKMGIWTTAPGDLMGTGGELAVKMTMTLITPRNLRVGGIAGVLFQMRGVAADD
jgi:hypothetical protein